MDNMTSTITLIGPHNLPIVQPERPATYRKTKSGEWVVVALASDLQEAQDAADAAHSQAAVIVTKKDGTEKTVVLRSIGRAFDSNGETLAYGYIDDGWGNF